MSQYLVKTCVIMFKVNTFLGKKESGPVKRIPAPALKYKALSWQLDFSRDMEAQARYGKQKCYYLVQTSDQLLEL